MTTPANPADLITWLRAQLDDDERLTRKARAAAPGGWVSTYRNVHAVDQESGATSPVLTAESGALAWHAARHDPARVLAEVDAKRRILDGHPFEQGIVGGVCGTCHGAGRLEVYWDGEEETLEHVDTEMVWPCPTVRLLALPYADRPGYREEWKP